MGSMARCVFLAMLLAQAFLSGCANETARKLPEMEGGRFVLRWEGLSGPAGDPATEWKWFCYEVDDPQACQAVKQWITKHYEALLRPSEFIPMETSPAKQLCWLPPHFSSVATEADVTAGMWDAKWDIWLFAPSLSDVFFLSKSVLLESGWDENLPFKEFDKLREIFKACGKAVDQQRSDVRAALGTVQPGPKQVFRGGTYMLALIKDIEADWQKDTKAWSCHKIDDEAGRKFVEGWIAANYEAVRISDQHANGPPGQVLLWFDEKAYVWIELWMSVLVGHGGPPGEMMYVKNLPVREFETLKRFFEEHGKVVDFVPDKIRSTRKGVRLSE